MTHAKSDLIAGGKSIYCPHCKNRTTVYHLQWTALKCYHCQEMVDINDWRTYFNNKLIMEQNEYYYLEEVRSILKNVLAREAKRHQMDEHLVPGTGDVIEEIIGMLEEQLDYDPTPNELGEPPITAAEMHAAAWKEHQAMHS